MASTSTAKKSSAATKKLPNWLEMPDELMANILQRLRTLELLSVKKVCTSWSRVCKDPAIWKVINVDNYWGYTKLDLERLTKEAVDLSCGELVDISIRGFGTDDLLNYIVQRSSKLNRLFLGGCKNITGSGLSRAVKMVPQLEKLHLGHVCVDVNAEDIELIGRNCPQLKSLIMAKRFQLKPSNDNAFAIANSMPELRELELTDEMTNDGLKAVLNGCPHLQSLNVRWCFFLTLEEELQQLCKERIKKFVWDSTGDDWCYYQMCGYMDSEEYDSSESDA